MNKPMNGQFCWTELATADVKKAKDFYGKLFGWQFREMKSDTMTYTIISLQNNEFGGIWEIPNDQRNQIPPHWMNYILVENIADVLAKAKQQGATVVKDISQAGDMGRFAIITDPTGAHIAFWETTSK